MSKRPTTRQYKQTQKMAQSQGRSPSVSPERQTEIGVQMANLLEEFKSFKKDMKQEMRENREEIKEQVRKEVDKLGGKIERISEEIGEVKKEVKEVKIRACDLERTVKSVKERLQQEEGRGMQLELKYREKRFKLRGLSECANEKLEERIIPALEEFLELEDGKLETEIDRMFRINSIVARERKVPRDIVIYLLRTKIRDLIVQRSYKGKLVIENEEIQIFKDVPSQILKKRQEYKFLTRLLMKGNIEFRWERVEVVSFIYKQRRYRVDTIEKAKEMYDKLQKEWEDGSKKK
ncbi:uncharacterized protein PF11_0207-like [Sceloporus undulatus]|uniref:uncharacterized protein PF11_0207-like n=1 Tax=Sceloporus undulatus TaxID=8520 RepID=UPI001C4BF300|nr:uncharacterized protein PF11_0207-like [Sceloporus undulatus]